MEKMVTNREDGGSKADVDNKIIDTVGYNYNGEEYKDFIYQLFEFFVNI